jgi:hypothetical protein
VPQRDACPVQVADAYPLCPILAHPLHRIGCVPRDHRPFCCGGICGDTS